MPPAKLACKGCRLSKVKCDLEAKVNSLSTGKCSRCDRLGLQCLPTGPSKRGRPHAARDISRLGPAVRQLLNKGDCAGENMKLMDNTRQDVRKEACRILTSQLTTREAKWAWMRHILYINQRARSIEAMANAMMTACEMGFTLDEVQAATQEVDLSEPVCPEPLPDFLQEWYAPSAISLTRFQNSGLMEWVPSKGFEQLFGVSGTLDAGMISLLEDAEDRKHIVSVTGRLWAQVASGEDADSRPQHVQAEGDREILLTLRGRRVGPFRLRGRLVVKDRSLRTWTCINLLPVKPPPQMLPLLAANDFGLAAPRFLAAPGLSPTASGAGGGGGAQQSNDRWSAWMADSSGGESGAQSVDQSGARSDGALSRAHSDSFFAPLSAQHPDQSGGGMQDALQQAPPHHAAAGHVDSAPAAAPGFLGGTGLPPSPGPSTEIPLSDLDALFTGEDDYDVSIDEFRRTLDGDGAGLPIEQLLAMVSEAHA